MPDQVALMGGCVPLSGEAGDARKADIWRKAGRAAGPADGGGPCLAHAPAERPHRKLSFPLFTTPDTLTQETKVQGVQAGEPLDGG